ncbi:hypothetical protein MYSTI_02541 [Myxococcus stipitatus DSM 14675]|uniref:Uncharacterized protein n=1 Tax=Myxococcus stipitatus (strain DSM 14675 / JCM 12634 / Mx s8) TaxID=1278073 RepID=L7U8G9_MYXSD|nr:hypothetical protein [Myxococcus stipitatus]AGC43857.1 hypothetical protein MYSTI_02541 [Myxococcus stipitatus DSM 14675]
MVSNVGNKPPPSINNYKHVETKELTEQREALDQALNDKLKDTPAYEQLQAKRYSDGPASPTTLAFSVKQTLDQLEAGKKPAPENVQALKVAHAALQTLSKQPAPTNLDEAKATAEQTKAILEQAKGALVDSKSAAKAKASSSNAPDPGARLDHMLKTVNHTLGRIEEQKTDPVKHLNGVSTVIANAYRDHSAKGSYEFMVNGAESKNLSPEQMKVYAQKTSNANALWGHKSVKSADNTDTGMDFVRNLSQENIKRLETEIKASGPLKPYEKEILHSFMTCDFVMSHSTTPEGREAIENSGKVLSKVRIENLATDPAQVHNNTPKSDEQLLRNNDFVFFRFEAGTASDSKTRYGSETLRYNANDTQLFQRGWITMEDQLTPKVLEPLKRADSTPMRKGGFEQDSGNQVFAASASATTTGAPSTNKVVREYQLSKKKSPEGDELFKLKMDHHTHHQVFYGPDIRQGVGLSVVAELRRIQDPKYNKELGVEDTKTIKSFFKLEQPGAKPVTDEMAQKLLKTLFRPEAKLPGQVFLDAQSQFTSKT